MKTSQINRVSGLLFLLAGVVSAATVNVRNFSAMGSGYGDDSAAIQTAIDKSRPGDVIYFPRGTYRLMAEIRLANGRTYKGDGSGYSALRQDNIAGQQWTMRTPYATADITVDGLAMLGAGMLVDDRTAARNVEVKNCAFRHIKAALGAPYVLNYWFWSSGGLNNSRILNNYFLNIPNGSAIGLRRVATTLIQGNRFENVQQGMSVVFDPPGPYPGVVVSGNSGRGIHRMGIEMQGGGTQNMVVRGNRFEDFRDPYYDTMGLSIVVDGGSDTLIAGNTLIAEPAARPGQRYGYGIEVGGLRSVVQNNVVQGNWWYCISMGGAPQVQVLNNYLSGSAQSLKIAWQGGRDHGGETVSGNTLQVE